MAHYLAAEAAVMAAAEDAEGCPAHPTLCGVLVADPEGVPVLGSAPDDAPDRLLLPQPPLQRHHFA